MSALKLDVEIMHPPALVWRALTESKALNEWFQPVAGWPESGARPGSHGMVYPTDDLAGFGTFELDVVEAEPHSRLVTRWRGDDFTSEVAFEIRPIPGGGSRLLIRQTGFLGTRETERRETLVRAYQVMFERLRATAGRLALGLGEGAFLRAEAPEPAPAPPPPVVEAQHRLWIIAMVCVVIVAGLCGTAGAVWMSRGNTPPFGGPMNPASGENGLGTGVQPVVSGLVSRSPAVQRTQEKNEPSSPAGVPSPATASGTPLTAGYRIRALPVGLLGFDVDVTVRNPGSVAKNGWTVVLTMPDATAVRVAAGSPVKLEQHRDVVTVTPADGTLSAGGSVTFTVRYPALLALGPSIKGCTIDGQACTAG